KALTAFLMIDQNLWSVRKIIMQWIDGIEEIRTPYEMDRAFLEKLNVIGSKIYKNFKMTLSKMTLSCVLHRFCELEENIKT
ncbi:hypothetical protein ACJX0J_027879, partial [Zea mays]